MKNLVIASCSLKPSNFAQKVKEYREIEYLNCIKQLLRVLPKNYEIIICENTIDNTSDILNEELNLLLKENNTFFLGSENNNLENIGFGELKMLHTLIKKHDLNKYKFISCLSARKFYTCPYVFEKTNSLNKEALISNPDFLFLNGNYRVNPKENLYATMFYSMKTSTMIEYANFAYEIIKKKEKTFLNLINRKLNGSEQILFEFIKRKKISYEYIDWLGIIRNDWRVSDDFFDVNNFHIC